MKNTVLGIALILLALASSCVPHKNIVYYQDKDSTTDTILTLIEQPKPYRLQVNDVISIRIKVLDQENVEIFNPIGEGSLTAPAAQQAYFDGFTVDTHGNIRVPTLGYLNVLGYTTEEVRELIESRLLEDQFKETANIFVTVKLSGLKFHSSGEVGQTGTQIIFEERLNLHEAIANVGGITEFGDATDILIIRKNPQGTDIHHVDLTDINVMYSPYYYIQPNDMIYVKPLKQKSLGIGTTGLQSFTTIISILTVVSTTILLFSR